MTRKHYIAMAQAFKLVKVHGGDTDTIAKLARELASVLKVDNPRFDKDKFLTACGVE
jgi:hypothetical protein